MTLGRIEHVNLTVSDIERSAALFERLLGWRQRWRGKSAMGGETIHVGEDATYLALYANPSSRPTRGDRMNHVGFVVADLDAAERVLAGEGIETYWHDDYEPGRRFYFRDWDGIEFEVVSYD